MTARSPTLNEMPLKMVTSNKFGRYPKISVEQVFNNIISDDWMVPNAGYKKVLELLENGQGRGIFRSTRSNTMIVVIDNIVYSITSNISERKVGELNTFTGDVFIDEDEIDNIAICDKKNIWVYNTASGSFQKATLDFLPVYVAYQNGRFVSADQKVAQWRLNALGNPLSWPPGPNSTGSFQTKGDNIVATVPFPSRENLILIIGKIVTEFWTDVGAPLFPYQKNIALNIDYGCLNAATIAKGDKIVVWLAANEKSGPVVMYTDGGDPVSISTDGIDFRLANLTNPENCYGFLYKQDGHLIYQFCFPDDNLSYIYDFRTSKFFTVTDHQQNFHIAKRVVFYNNTYYFVSLIDGNLYELSSKYTTYDGHEIPRIIVCENIRLPNSSYFIVNSLTFPIEAGNTDEDPLPRVDLSISVDGGESFSSIQGMEMRPQGKRQFQLIWYNLGLANDFIAQFRFWGTGRFVFTNGTASVYQ